MNYLHDFSVGQVFIAGPLEVTADEIKQFAQRYDPQPFHLDEAAAEASFFKGLAASGWMTGSLSMRLLTECGLNIPGGLIGAGVELSWPRPTFAGDVIRLETTVLELLPSRSKPDRGMIRIQSRTLNQREEEVMIMTARVLAPVRPDAR